MLTVLLQTELPSSNLPYLFAAFAVSWAAFFVYAFFVTRRQQELQGEIEGLRQALEHREAPDPE
jgi:CcmD family protein